jgi:hypothetical protein
MVLHNLLLLLIGEMVVPGNQAVVLVCQAIAFLPVEELSALNANESDNLLRVEFGLPLPCSDEIDDLVAQFVGNPAPIQGSPTAFFRVT